MQYYGRRKIFTDVESVTSENIVSVLNDAIAVHSANVSEENGLWNIYKGKTDILGKTKEYRETINNIVNENRAMQITEFYQGYIFGEPITYVRRGDDESLNDEVEWLNDYSEFIGKQGQDNDLAEYVLVMGVCPKIVLPKKGVGPMTYVVDPRRGFNVYSSNLAQDVLMSVVKSVKNDGTEEYACYTDRMFYRIKGSAIVEAQPHTMRGCPMVEYTLNNVRMGIFEPVIPLLNALDKLQSNRIDDVEQFVNSILVIVGGELTDETMSKLAEYGALSLPEGVDAKYLTSALRQADVQTLKNDLITAITEITGMPNRNGGTSTSDTGSAVMLRDGWETADAKSKRIEIQYKKAEKELLAVFLNISYAINKVVLDPSAVEIRFTRRNYENIQTKAQVLTQMLASDKIAPELAFLHSGMFSDPLLAYEMSERYRKEREESNEGNQMSQLPQTALEG